MLRRRRVRRLHGPRRRRCAVCACLVLAAEMPGHEITTIEGLASGGRLDPLQAAFVECGAVQCGFCIPGMIMSARALLNGNPRPTREEVQDALSGNLCRWRLQPNRGRGAPGRNVVVTLRRLRVTPVPLGTSGSREGERTHHRPVDPEIGARERHRRSEIHCGPAVPWSAARPARSSRRGAPGDQEDSSRPCGASSRRRGHPHR